MAVPLLHPERTDDERLLRWVINAVNVPQQLPQLTALINEGILEHIDISPGEIRTRLAPNRSWNTDGPRVRSELFEALSTVVEKTGLNDAELQKRVADIIERDVAPLANSHGGAIHIASLRDGVLTLELQGACHGCPQSQRTVGQLVARAVQDRYPQIREVRSAKPRPVWLGLNSFSRQQPTPE